MLNRYKEVVMLNEELLTGCYIRRTTQEQAVISLKNLHTLLQQAIRLRGTFSFLDLDSHCLYRPMNKYLELSLLSSEFMLTLRESVENRSSACIWDFLPLRGSVGNLLCVLIFRIHFVTILCT